MLERLTLEGKGPSPIEAGPELRWSDLPQPVDGDLEGTVDISNLGDKELKKVVTAPPQVLF